MTQTTLSLLIDTDAFSKLGACGLLEPALETLGATVETCGRLPALPQMLRKGRLAKWLGIEVCNRLLPLAQRMPQMTRASIAWLDRMTSLPQVDPGEAQLFALCAERGIRLVTGDKRALRAVSTSPQLVEQLSGKVILLERVLLQLCSGSGTTSISTSVAQHRRLDTMLQVCFSEADADPVSALQSYLDNDSRELAPLLLWQPEGAPR